jgi:hypothetical protein
MRTSLNRRDMLRNSMRGILGLSAAVVATQFGVSEVVAEDMQLELAKDLKRTTVAMPGQTLIDRQEIWFSVANVAEVWSKQLADAHPRLADDRRLFESCKKMARALDHDLETARIKDDMKVLVEMPQLTFPDGRLGQHDRPQFELRCGVEQTSTLWSSRTRVGFIGSGGILTGEAVDTARRGLFGLK